MAKPLIAKSDYQKLLKDLRRVMDQGLKKVEELFDRQKIFTYWALGKRINSFLHSKELPPGEIGKFFLDVSRDLEINFRTLYQCEQFYRLYPKLKPEPFLKWSHYRFLLSVPQANKRAEWIRRIIKEKISSDQLRLALLPTPQAGVSTPQLKEPVRGRLYTYRILHADDIENFEIPWFVDVGFAGRREAPACEAVLDNKYLYTSQKIKDIYQLKVTDAKVDQLFTFVGRWRRVIDGDTLLVNIDQGFSFWNEQRLRFKGINTSELSDLAGQKAKKWLEDELKDSPQIVVKTYKSDNWDRYLVDVFYLPGEDDMNVVAQKGRWLNGYMVEQGIATIWTPMKQDT